MPITSVDWQKLDATGLEALINAVRTTSESQLFSSAHSEAVSAHLPFYNEFQLYRLSNYSTLPVFTTEYLSNGTSWHYIDGTPECLIEINKQDGMRLTPRTVVDYLSFYFEHVLLEEGEILTYERRGYNSAPRGKDIKLPPPTIEFLPATESFLVHMPLYVDGTLMHGAVKVSSQGHVSFETLRPFLTDAATAFNSLQSMSAHT